MTGITALLTTARLRAVCPKADLAILEALISGTEAEYAAAGIVDSVVLAHFLAQIATETGGLSRLDENLNYTTAARIKQVFGKRIKSDAIAQSLVGKPEDLANLVYANVNGNKEPGDGFRYRGSGLIQITGRGNFAVVSKLTGIDIVTNPELARHPDSALELALAFWTARKISAAATQDTEAAVVKVTKLVNGGTNGLDERQTYFRKAMKALEPAVPVALSRAVPAAVRSAAAEEKSAAVADGLELSGAQWTARFPTSQSIADLAAPFSDHVAAFVKAMQDAGATVQISATFRPKERAYLMHWAWMIGKTGFDPASVPPMPGVAIQWRHPTPAATKAAALDMVAAYGMVQVAVLNSRHTEREAIDMTIRWAGTLNIRQPDETVRSIGSQPRNGGNAELVRVGHSYGVIKLISDPPHWSNDGR